MLMQKQIFLKEHPYKFVLFSLFQSHVNCCPRQNCFCKKVAPLQCMQDEQGLQVSEEFYEKFLRLLALGYKKGVRDLHDF